MISVEPPARPYAMGVCDARWGKAPRDAPAHQPLLGASMPQARQRPNAGGVNRLEERLWPSSPAKRLCAARRRDGHAYQINRLGVATSKSIHVS